MQRFGIVLCLLFCLGCGVPEGEGLVLRFDRSALTVDKVKIFVRKVGGQEESSCGSFWDKTLKTEDFDQSSFEKVKEFVISGAGSQSIKIGDLTVGKKDFIVEGYYQGKKLALGCGAGTIALGKRLSLAILLLKV